MAECTTSSCDTAVFNRLKRVVSPSLLNLLGGKNVHPINVASFMFDKSSLKNPIFNEYNRKCILIVLKPNPDVSRFLAKTESEMIYLFSDEINL